MDPSRDPGGLGRPGRRGHEESQPLEVKEEGKGEGHTAYLWGRGVYMLFPDLERQEKPLLLLLS